MPYECEKCDFSSDRFYNVVRHRERKHPEIKKGYMDDEEHSEGSEQESESAQEESESGEEESENEKEESEVEEVDDDDDDVVSPQIYDELVEKAWAQHESKFQELVQEYVNEGKSESDAKQEAYDKILPPYRKSFRKEYMDMLLKQRELKNDATYQSVMASAKRLRENDESDSVEESLRAAVSKRKYLLNELVEEDYENAFPEEDMDDDV